MSKMRSPFGVAATCTGGFPKYNSPPAPSKNSSGAHAGEDYVPANQSAESNWTLYSPCDGEVYISKKQTGSYSGGYGAFGNYLVIVTPDKKMVLMAHQKTLPIVKAGEKVKAGQKVGVAGNTGNSKGRHLHIEVADMNGVSYNSSTWYEQEQKHLVRPSEYIDFSAYAPQPAPTPTPGGGFEVKTWKNGSTREPVYSTVADCKAGKNQIGSLDPRETASCYGIEGGCYIVAYNAGGTRKVGFVKYAGGVK